MQVMKIGELSRRTGVSQRSLRYYEQKGLLTARRGLGGHREYAESAVARVQRIQVLFRAGLNSDTIFQILPCMRDHDGGPSDTADEKLTEDLANERKRIRARIRAEQETLRHLDIVIAAAGGNIQESESSR